jgi:proteasome alpha subunit
VKEISAVKQAFTQYAGMRPFGVSFIIGGVDDSGARLFETEPSGALAEYKAVAIGNNRKEAMKVLEAKWNENLTLDDAMGLAIEALEKGLPEKEKLDFNRLELAYVDSQKTFTRIPKLKLKTFLGKVKK